MSQFAVLLVWRVQVVRRRSCAELLRQGPTAVPVFASTKETPLNQFVVPLLWRVH
jgi:hypothetical protein